MLPGMTILAATPPLTDTACLGAWLRLRGIPVESFGSGEAKTIDHLLGELRAGESQLALEGGTLVRRIEGASVIVLADAPEGRRMVLTEDHQQFSDGRVRRRRLGNSIGEKLVPGEVPEQAARRALSEELGLPGTGRLSARGLERGRVVSTSYPGLCSENRAHRFIYELGPGEWRAGGYTERQSDKTTVFCWEEVLAEDETMVRSASGIFWFAGPPANA